MHSSRKIRFYVDKMTDWGIRPAEVLKDTGISPIQLHQGVMVTQAQHLKVINNMLCATEREDLGVQLGCAIRLSDYDILGYAMASSESISKTYYIWELYNKDLYGALVDVEVVKYGDSSEIRPHINLSQGPAYRLCLEEFIVSCDYFLSVLTKKGGGFSSVHLSYPRLAYHQKFEQRMQCEVHYNCERDAIFRDGNLLGEEILLQDKTLNDIYLDSCHNLASIRHHDSDLSGKILNLFYRTPGNLPTLPELADTLNMSERTLRRKLQQDGETYRGLTNRFRSSYAKDCLSSTSASIAEIAYLLGYSDSKAFIKSFKSQFGISPGEFRKTSQQGKC